jgi:hypothetical protein
LFLSLFGAWDLGLWSNGDDFVWFSKLSCCMCVSKWIRYGYG